MDINEGYREEGVKCGEDHRKCLGLYTCMVPILVVLFLPMRTYYL